MSQLVESVRTFLKPAPRRFTSIEAEQLEERILMSAAMMVDPQLLLVESASGSAPTVPLIAEESPPLLAPPNASPTAAFKPGCTYSTSALVETPVASRLELIFVDSSTPDYQRVLDDLLANPDSGRAFEVYLLDADRDGVQQISEILQGYSDVDAIHWIAHSEDGAIQLGNVRLNSANLIGYASEIHGWQSSLAADADLLLYGCDLADSSHGLRLISGLHALTGADVAASVDATGHRDWGGNWQLEYAIGEIETRVAPSESLQDAWRVKLATITVTTVSDVVNSGDGLLSLREAVIQANAGSGGDTIVLSAGTYSLSITGTGENSAATGDLDLLKSVTIQGAGKSTVIDANGIDRVFHVLGGTTTLSQFTVREGDAGLQEGGGLLVASGATAHIEDVTFVSNAAGRGGAIFSDGTLTLERVLVENNQATVAGGGMSLSNSTSLFNVTVHSNTSAAAGGIDLRSGNLTAINTTISTNSATSMGGGIQMAGTASFQNVTIANNTAATQGSGIHVSPGGSVSLRNTLIAGNLNAADTSGAFSSLGYNLIGKVGTATGLVHGINNDQVGSNSTPINANLGPLAYNGGVTPTHALLAGSLAINAGTTTGAPLSDQRGFARSGNVDIGAFESSTASPIYSVNEFRGNTATSGAQETSHDIRGSHRSIALAADGSYTVVWSDDTLDGNGWGIYAKQFNADGTVRKSDFRINATTTGDQRWATIASDDSGRFVVAWTSDDGGDSGIYLRRFNADGSAIDTSDVLVNWQSTAGDQLDPSIAMNNAGKIVIAWHSEGSSEGVFAKLFDMSSPAASNQVPTSIIAIETGAARVNAVVDINEAGKFVVVWQNGLDSFGKRFNADGTARGVAIDLSLSTTTEQAVVAIHASGEFVVAYRSNSFLLEGIWMRRFADDGTALFAPIKVSSGSSHTIPSLAMDASGNFIVAYEGDGDGTDQGVFGRIYSANGTSQGAQFQINQSTTGDQEFVSVAMANMSNYVATWSGNGTQPGHVDSQGVFVRQFGTASIATNNAPNGANDSYTVAEDGTLTTHINWTLSGWSTRRQIAFNNGSGTTLTNQVVLIELNASNIDYARIQNAGQDLRFVDSNGTLLDYEIESWNESGTSTVWVRVPQIDAASNSDFIWMYYGNTTAADGQNAPGVWSSGNQAVLHLNGTPSDSVSPPNAIVNVGTTSTTGIIGGARTLDGLDDEINVGSATAVDDLFATGGTISAWIRPTGWGENGYGRIADKGSTTFGGSNGNGWAFQVNGADGSLIFEHGFSAAQGEWRTAAGTISLNTWQMVTLVFDASSASNDPRIYIDGVEVVVTETRTPAGTMNSDAALDLKIGNHSLATSRSFDGQIDEFRALDVSLTSDQISASYRSMAGLLTNFGALQNGGVSVLANDSDPDSDPLTATLVSGPSHAQGFTFNADGTFTYQPTANYFGGDSFTYLVNDAVSSSGPITVFLTISSVNDQPTITSHGGASTVTLNRNENATAVTSVTATDVDLPAQALTYSLSGGADQARFTIHSTTGALSFTTAPDFETPSDSDGNNSYLVEVTVSDGNGGSDTQFVTVVVVNVSESPVGPVTDANAAANQVNENAANGTGVGIVARAIDPDPTNNAVTYTLDNDASGRFSINASTGLVTVADGTLLDRETSSQHAIVVRATSQDGSFSTQAFTIDILGVNDHSPVVTSSTLVSTPENQVFVGQLTATDADLPTQTLTFTIVGGPDRLLFDVNSANELIFRRPPNFEDPQDADLNNIYLIVARVSDGQGRVTDQAISVRVTNVNEAPVIGDQSYGMFQGESYQSAPGAALIGAFDPEGQPLSAVLLTSTSQGSLTFQADGTFAYTPNTEFLGSDSFTIRVTDGQGRFSIATITMVVNPSILPIPNPNPIPLPSGILPSDPGSPSDSSSDSSESTTSEKPADTSDDSAKSDSSPTLQAGADVQASTIEASSKSSDKTGTELTGATAESAERTSIGKVDRNGPSNRVADASFEYRVIREFARQASLRATEQIQQSVSQSMSSLLPQSLLWKDLDQLRQHIQSVDVATPITLGTATGVASGISVGYVMWLLRGGYIIAGVMAQLPAWGLMDPLPILSQLDDFDNDDDDSLESMVDKANSHQDSLVQADEPPQVMEPSNPALPLSSSANES